MNSMCSSNTFETLKLAAKILFFFKTKLFYFRGQIKTTIIYLLRMNERNSDVTIITVWYGITY
ncbi:hypothetical protein DERP_006774 [Dermatophagoides pteronyssinus]|uniref:Uncharacterized protein n=1 Tax=Dermatophagoides pteronyssinus TaxID=6956 RepID=A0ABQ8IRZ3_DERPT|nr:hypothetical protein DERP_006774 [Dermatophagoides pteronyssinus]